MEYYNHYNPLLYQLSYSEYCGENPRPPKGYAPAGNRTRGYCLEGNNVTTTPPGLKKWVVNPNMLPAGLEPATSAWLIRADEGVKPR